MKDRTLVQRALLRRALRKENRHSNEQDSSLIQLALDDPTVFETLYDMSMKEAKRFGDSSSMMSVTRAQNGALVVDNLLKLLQWFVTNGPALVELITQIIDLFGTFDVAVEIWESETLFLD